MKLVDRKTFLGLPKGTVFCKFPLNHESYADKMPIEIGAPQIKGDSLTNDFYAYTLGEDMMPTEAEGSDDYFKILFEMQKNLNQDVPFGLVGGRDGFFDDENVGFMIFSKTEVQEMITELSECLKIAYQDETDDLQNNQKNQ